MRHKQLMDLQQQHNDKLGQLTATIESLTELYTAKLVSKMSEMHQKEWKPSPINSGKPDWEIVQAFFQFWYDHNNLKELYLLYIVAIACKMCDRRYVLQQLHHPKELTMLKWTRDYHWLLLVLDRMRRRFKEFIEYDGWETWFDSEHGWDIDIFKPNHDSIEQEQLEAVALVVWN
ncbi:hypothetical protein BU25DRAFT_180236 [Macroventuria anomochaeta]|uniref:Uncharacterized protein n=1 Tax=Macroventuria anomochaeta TaxID=301207 RepID=A0ACB6RN57_9PLEO|nr:uncharacterized protein BU25DRAFT_180236 [Macroventuria anomochaeta]KAF2623238.1 hypothetical protein BU25DRAFT_180236 [Macroventuria anomochaeta]